MVVKAAAVPHAVVGIAIAIMVLLPETWAAVRAALRNRNARRNCPKFQLPDFDSQDQQDQSACRTRSTRRKKT